MTDSIAADYLNHLIILLRMAFDNEKKTVLSKTDKSRKGSIDARMIPLLKIINGKKDYYTTSSCSGRAYLWKGSGKKSETQWLKVSHDLIETDFFETEDKNMVWLRLEGIILHAACRDLEAANVLLNKARKDYKKSSILSASNKIIVEVKGSEFMEMPLYKDGRLLFSGDLDWLRDLINTKLNQMWENLEKFRRNI